MKRKKAYEFDKIIKRISSVLIDDKWHTPNEIAKKIGINPRTAQKYIVMGANLGLFITDTFETNNILICKINAKYKDIFIEITKNKKMMLDEK